ncbi:N,N-dimethylformamidase large subunit [Pseudomonas sp. SWRI74]|uniref:N,N-dimethylformamidase large subunit n=1 Tax=Pseudomonas azerbaijanoccidentalis TaxID=2842347 RepID=A0ABS6QQB9_9PSED|nr:N,N-dimethylformamidase beta subunit family domain-containing protein [Pseudomonas azerbaijanoccidentalis]MBV4521132.1 N,N-dimethylformamidase large subunit [Pseudomonas azerbaijanoccidentalis]
MTHSDINSPAVIGYVTPLSAQPGELLEFKISSTGDQDIRARVVRLDCCDPNPEGPGLKSPEIDFGLVESYRATEQKTYLGSCAIAPLPVIPEAHSLKLSLLIKPTLFSATDQVIFSIQDETGTSGFALSLNEGTLILKGLGTHTRQELDLRPEINRWSELEISFAWDTVILHSTLLRTGHTVESNVPMMGLLDTLKNTSHLCLAATWCGHPEDCFNGSIEAPCLSSSPLSSTTDSDVLARWSFANDAYSQTIKDDIDPSRTLTLVNMPMRGVRSSGWTGRNMDWKTAPDEYAAITFHADDLSDCQWNTTLTVQVPKGVPSGIYGLVVDNRSGTDTIPFYVLPGADSPRRKILFLAPTFTYQAYANHTRGTFAGALQERVREWNAYPHNPDVIGAFGYSNYNRHPDGSGITLSSRLRPIMTMRPAYLVYLDEHGSGMRGFASDSHLTDWLNARGFEFDVITDEDLDREGIEALAHYDVVMTGTQPEYHTRRTLEALIAYREGGGKLMYLGGNGFYWKIGRDPQHPHMIEVRRAEGGMRVWACQPGEYYHQLDGEYGGLWRRNGIAPQQVAGVGFTAEGAFEGTYYVRTRESFHSELAFLFEGIPSDQKIGDFGLSGGGAAGFEIDQVCSDLGTPDFVTVIAASEGHGPTFETTFEELLLPGIFDGGPRPYGGICSNIVYGIDENGGGLFSVGSITFCGSLSHNHYDNNVSRLLENCLRKFLELSYSSDELVQNLSHSTTTSNDE